VRVFSLDNMSELSSLPKKPPGAMWIDLGPSEISILLKFGISPEAYAVDSHREYPRHLERIGHTSIVLFLPPKETGQKTTRPLGRMRLVIYITPSMLLSVGASELLDWFIDECVHEQGMKKASREETLLQILYRIVHLDGASIPPIEGSINRLEGQMADEKGGIDLAGLFSRKRHLIALHKVFWRERDIIHEFKNTHLQFLKPDKPQQARLDDLYNTLLFDINSLENLRELLTDGLDIHHTMVSNRINKSIEKLTLVTVWLTILATVSAFPNTIATILGIPYLPFEPHRAVAVIAGFTIYPWQIVLALLTIFTAVPAYLVWHWLKKMLGNMF